MKMITLISPTRPTLLKFFPFLTDTEVTLQRLNIFTIGIKSAREYTTINRRFYDNWSIYLAIFACCCAIGAS